MGLDIYVGTLTRYYSGNWKLINQIIAEQEGMTFSIKTPEGEYTPPTYTPKEIEEIRNNIEDWQTYLLDSIPEDYKDCFSIMRIFRKVTNTHRGMVTNQLDYFSVHL